MAALDFPTSPTVGQVYTANGSTWVWNGTAWSNADVVPATSGGTGLTSSGAAGNILTSDGTGWVSGAAPSGEVEYPQNVQSGNYTLVLADAGKHIYSANTATQTITIPTNASVAFPIGTTITIVNEGTDRIVLSRTGVTIKPNGSNAALSVPAIAPSQSVQLLKTGTNSWKATFGVIIEKPATLQYLVIAGGAGAQYGGGGAGGYLAGTQDFSLGTLTITVGAGGAGNTNGANSVLNGSMIFTAIGGGKGGQYATQVGSVGGSGGGGTGGQLGGAGTTGQGNDGGAGTSGTYSSGGGGGGAGAVGGNALANGQGGGAGGAGLSSSITGTAITRAGGGGGSTIYGTGGVGGAGGGGSAATGTAGTANTGGGGGAQNNAGGSGVVIIRTRDTVTSTTGSPTITTVNGDTVYQFNSSGTITFG